MNKVILVLSCRECPYMGFYKKEKRYICMILSSDISTFIEQNIINPMCKLDDAVIEKKHFNDPNIPSSEGTVVCKMLPENDSFNEYLIGQQYQFQRQVDGNIRLYHYGIDTYKYMLYPPKVFEKYFRIEGEQSINTDNHEICPVCKRVKRWCECL